MVEENENSYEVIRPGQADRSGSPPGKNIVNSDILNAAYMAYLDSIKDRAREIGEELQSEIRRYEHSENDQHYIYSGDASARVIEIHTLILTYFEGVAFRFFQWAAEANHELESNIRDRAHGEFPDEPPRGWDEDTQKRFQRAIGPRNYLKAIESADLINNSTPIHSVKSRRNTFVHNPVEAYGLRTDHNTESYIFDDDNKLSDMVSDCMAALDEIENMVEKNLPIEASLYNSLSESFSDS